LQSRYEFFRRLIRKRFAERESDRRREAFLNAIPGVLESGRRVLFFDDERLRVEPIEKRIPFALRNLVENVDDRDDIEVTADDVVVANDEADAVDAPHFAQI